MTDTQLEALFNEIDRTVRTNEADAADQLSARYLEHRGVRCPYCHSVQLEGDGIDLDEGGAYQPVRCLDCGRSWTDCYRLTGIVEDDAPTLQAT